MYLILTLILHYITISLYNYITTHILGEVGSNLCDMSELTTLSLASNPNMTCYADCVLNVNQTNFGDMIACPTTQDDIICGIVAATNIVSIAGYDEWNCDASGYPATEPCAVDNAWSGLTCDVETLTVVAINFRNSSVVGTLPESLGNLGELSFLDLGYNSLYGNTSN